MRLGVGKGCLWGVLGPVLSAARHWKRMFVKCAGFSFRCGSAFPVCYLISVLGAARRWKGMFVRCAGFDFRCGSASPVCYLISVLGDLGAAQLLLFVPRSQFWVRLGVGKGCL